MSENSPFFDFIDENFDIDERGRMRKGRENGKNKVEGDNSERQLMGRSDRRNRQIDYMTMLNVLKSGGDRKDFDWEKFNRLDDEFGDKMWG